MDVITVPEREHVPELDHVQIQFLPVMGGMRGSSFGFLIEALNAIKFLRCSIPVFCHYAITWNIDVNIMICFADKYVIRAKSLKLTGGGS